MPMHYNDGKGHKQELRSNRNYIKFKSHHYLFIASGVDTQIHTHAYLHEGGFKSQPHAGLHASGLKIWLCIFSRLPVLFPGIFC